MKKAKYKVTILLLLVNVLFWIRLFALYIVRFANGGDIEYVIITVLLFLDIVAYALLAFGLWRDYKVFMILLVPFLTANAVLSVTDQMGFWDVAALILNLATMVMFFLERRKIKRQEVSGK